MSLLWRNELRVGLCPGRLIVSARPRWSRKTARSIHPVNGDPVAALAELAAGARLSVVLSNHYVRYAVLPWSKALGCEDDWEAFARHSFQATYGAAAAGWSVKLSPTGGKRPRVASAVDAALLEALRALPGLASIQPYLMAAFNVRRRSLGRGKRWFVLQEEGRLVASLLADGEWRLIRRRRLARDWQDALPRLLEHEVAASGEERCDAVALCSEDDLAPSAALRIVDVTLPPGLSPDARAHVMTLH